MSMRENGADKGLSYERTGIILELPTSQIGLSIT